MNAKGMIIGWVDEAVGLLNVVAKLPLDQVDARLNEAQALSAVVTKLVNVLERYELELLRRDDAPAPVEKCNDGQKQPRG